MQSMLDDVIDMVLGDQGHTLGESTVTGVVRSKFVRRVYGDLSTVSSRP